MQQIFSATLQTGNLRKSCDFVLAIVFSVCGSSFNFTTLHIHILVVSDLWQNFIARDQSDLLFDHISHVVASVCYLLGTIFKIRYKFRENLSYLIGEQSRYEKSKMMAPMCCLSNPTTVKFFMLIINFL